MLVRMRFGRGALLFILSSTCVATFAAESKLCPKWGVAREVGRLSASRLPEASGMAISRRFKDRIYFINDSGNKANLYISNMQGGNVQKVKIEDWKPYDVEALTLGPCPASLKAPSCIYIADVGDNLEKRKKYQILTFPEVETFGKEVEGAQLAEFTYPDGAHNSESFAVHPNGDLYLATKASHLKPLVPSGIYRVGKGVAVAERVGEIDLPAAAPGQLVFGQVATDMAISDDGGRFVLLTYLDAYEFRFDLSQYSVAKRLPAFKDIKKGADYGVISLKPLVQQEALGFVPGSAGLMYTTEKKKKADPPLMRVDCGG